MTEQAVWSRKQIRQSFPDNLFDKGPGFLRKSDVRIEGISDEDWKWKYGPRIVFDSGWYEHRHGDPLPPIESFRVPRHKLQTDGGKAK